MDSNIEEIIKFIGSQLQINNETPPVKEVKRKNNVIYKYIFI